MSALLPPFIVQYFAEPGKSRVPKCRTVMSYYYCLSKGANALAQLNIKVPL